MPLTITLTIPDADVPRLQAALTAGGQQPKQALQAFLVSLVQGYEQQQQLPVTSRSSRAELIRR